MYALSTIVISVRNRHNVLNTAIKVRKVTLYVIYAEEIILQIIKVIAHI